ncbi:regulatory protein RecX [Plesiomonas sp.]|uniref:regulatory protein RecX n=1 Tax=Plesiomonas sp. TaxID=2486279 RepID=UPI003F40FDEE
MNTALLNSALRLLAQREHSQTELRRKLAALFISESATHGDSSAETLDPESADHSREQQTAYKSPYSALNFAAKAKSARRQPAKATLHFTTQSVLPTTQVDFDLALDEVLEHCEQQHWVDDYRFAELFIRSRSHKGHGPRRIEQELRQRGVSGEITQDALAETDIDWAELAKQIAYRRFGELLPTTREQRSKIIRFMLYRGFYQEDIHSLW